jgi:hypothetical protein
MAAAVTGSATVEGTYPGPTAAQLTTIYATPVEQLTVGQVHSLIDALGGVAHGHDPKAVVGSLLT